MYLARPSYAAVIDSRENPSGLTQQGLFLAGAACLTEAGKGSALPHTSGAG